jgi:hypothetical protein
MYVFIYLCSSMDLPVLFFRCSAATTAVVLMMPEVEMDERTEAAARW